MRVILVEDDSATGTAVEAALPAGTVEHVRADVPAGDVVRAQAGAVLLGASARLAELRTAGVAAPIVLLVDEEPASSCGADGWLLRSEITTSGLSIAFRHARLVRSAAMFLERVSDGFVALDASWNFTYVNRKAAEVLGRSAEELLGKNSWEEFPDAVGHAFQHAYERAMTEQLPVVLEDHYAPWDRWFENRIYPSPAGLSIFFTETTERKRAEADQMRLEAELQKSRDDLRQLVESLDDTALALISLREPRVEYVTPSYERLTGRSVEEVLRIPGAWAALVVPEDLPAAAEARDRAVNGQCAEAVFRLRRGDGALRWMRLSAYPVRDATGAVHRIASKMRDVTDAKDLEEGLERQRRQLVRLSHQLIEAQELERRHIARELHDDLGPTFAAVRFGLQAIGRKSHDPETNGLISSGIDAIDEGIEKVRDLALDLRPPLLDDLGLGPALRTYADRQARSGGFTVTVTIPPDGRRYPAPVETACFRVAQEALMNAARHARARRVTIDLAERDGALSLAVHDDGVGFDLAAARQAAAEAGRLGLIGMQERMSLVGGELTLQSAPGSGTTVLAVFPSHAGEGTEP